MKEDYVCGFVALEEADFAYVSFYSGKRGTKRGALLGIMGSFANFHSTSTKVMMSRPPMASMEITKALFHAYVEPPWEMGIYLKSKTKMSKM